MKNEKLDLRRLIMNPGKAIRAWRQASGMTVGELAAEIGYSVEYLKDIENGRSRPSLAVLQGVLRFYDSRRKSGPRE